MKASFKLRFPIVLLALLLPAIPLPASRTRLPRFTDFPAGSIYRGKTHSLLSKYKDSVSKTGVPDAPQRKADFAGQYIVVEGSCGTGCSSLNVMDARTGEIYDFEHTIVETHPSDIPKLRYQLASKLLILHGNLDEKESTYGTYYYLFKGNHFVRLKYVPMRPHKMPVP